MVKVAILPAEAVISRILGRHGERVMLDPDIAGLYGVLTQRLNEQVRRNHARFPSDFMCEISEE